MIFGSPSDAKLRNEADEHYVNPSWQDALMK